MKHKIFIDGKDGTTGLKILEYFSNRNDIELITLEEQNRKNTQKRKECINQSDVTFLCLPDEAAREAVTLCQNDSTKIIDASTAHRTESGWAYGFPELSVDFRKNIASSKRVATPGCYASGFNAICFPLIQNEVIASDYPIVCHAVSGFSGGGKKAIAQYENANKENSSKSEFFSPRLYALTQEHKHLKEMRKISGLSIAPIFMPYICNHFAGMTVTIAFHKSLLKKKYSLVDFHTLFSEHYNESNFVKTSPLLKLEEMQTTFIAANTLSGTNNMLLHIYGNDERIIVTSQFDNLGKGASGAAIQCLNIMLGLDERLGLIS